MSYIYDALVPGERIVQRLHLHWVCWIRAWLFLIFLGIFLIGIVLFVRDWLILTNIEGAVTDRRLILKRGWIQRHVTDLSLTSIEVVNVDQDILGRLLNYGRVVAHGTGDDTWTSPIIRDPAGFRKSIAEAQHAAQTHRDS